MAKKNRLDSFYLKGVLVPSLFHLLRLQDLEMVVLHTLAFDLSLVP